MERDKKKEEAEEVQPRKKRMQSFNETTFKAANVNINLINEQLNESGSKKTSGK